MNHQKIYDNIVAKAKFENRKKLKRSDPDFVYYELHHIIPRCLGGSDEKINKVLLTAREHYICHKLLTYIHKGNSKLAYALLRIAFDKRDRKLSSREYSFVKELYNSIPMDIKQKENISLSLKGKPKSSIAKENMSKAKLGEGNGMFNKTHSSETKELMRNSHIGIPSQLKGTFKSNEFKELQREHKIGEKNAMFGKSFYDIWLIKYGKEIADEKLKNFKEKQKKRIPWNKGKTKL